MRHLKITMSLLLGLSLVLFSACGGNNEEDSPVISQSDAVSGCGGFALTRTPSFDDYTGQYCDAEVLHWEYDELNQKLDIRDARILLNCCGDHGMDIAFEDGIYVVTETDAPEGGAGRCACLCVFDYDLSATGIPGGVIPLRLMRHVSDSGNIYQVWEGELDLAEGSGFVILDNSPEDVWCGEYDAI